MQFSLAEKIIEDFIVSAANRTTFEGFGGKYNILYVDILGITIIDEEKKIIFANKPKNYSTEQIKYVFENYKEFDSNDALSFIEHFVNKK